MAQQQVLEHEVVAWPNPRKNGREEQPEKFEHIISIADLPSREVVPPHRVVMSCPPLDLAVIQALDQRIPSR